MLVQDIAIYDYIRRVTDVVKCDCLVSRIGIGRELSGCVVLCLSLLGCHVIPLVLERSSFLFSEKCHESRFCITVSGMTPLVVASYLLTSRIPVNARDDLIKAF